jgi:hypothetical protein
MTDTWDGNERRKSDRRADDDRREEARDNGPDRRKTDRRVRQYCFKCHAAFEPSTPNGTICPDCQRAALHCAA